VWYLGVHRRFREICCLHLQQSGARMVTEGSSETSINIYQTTRFHIPDDRKLHNWRYTKEFKSIQWNNWNSTLQKMKLNSQRLSELQGQSTETLQLYINWNAWRISIILFLICTVDLGECVAVNGSFLNDCWGRRRKYKSDMCLYPLEGLSPRRGERA
jgi:hypothetical protein